MYISALQDDVLLNISESWKLSTIISLSLTSTAETFALHIPCNRIQYCSHMPARNIKLIRIYIYSVFEPYISIKKEKKKDKILLTEMIPHRPQNKWFATVYFSASLVSLSTSSSLGLWSVRSIKMEIVKTLFSSKEERLDKTDFFDSSGICQQQLACVLGFSMKLLFSFYGVENRSWKKDNCLSSWLRMNHFHQHNIS